MVRLPLWALLPGGRAAGWWGPDLCLRVAEDWWGEVSRVSVGIIKSLSFNLVEIHWQMNDAV